MTPAAISRNPTNLLRSLPKMAPKSIDGTIERLVMLTETEAGKVARRSLGGVVERTDRNGGHPGLDRDVAAEVLVRAVETKRPEVGRHEVGAVRRQHVEADIGQGVRQAITLALHVGGEAGEISVAQAK